MDRIAVVGCGLVGTAWCIVSPAPATNVVMFDALEGATRPPGKRWRRHCRTSRPGLLHDQAPDDVLARLRPAASLAEAVARPTTCRKARRSG